MYNLCSKNKGADQLYSYRTADLRLCFHLCMLLLFICEGSCVLKYLCNTINKEI